VASKSGRFAEESTPVVLEPEYSDHLETDIGPRDGHTRAELALREHDAVQQIEKFNPLADWSEAQVWDYIRENAVPYNRLYDQGYRSIGCAPCTRPILPHEDIRAGRWWWEAADKKECGLHVLKKGGKTHAGRTNAS
jgi:3'-phosphoadenosine 5'-phosphosulfate sulfotransferase (PAPS reductase)/FAD synthetase